MVFLYPFTRLRFQRSVEHLHALGPSATAEFIAELSARIDGLAAALDLLDEYRARLSPRLPRELGGDRFPAHPLRVVRQ
jgi:hypothetical protein